MVRLHGFDIGPCEVFLKVESQNPGGFIKDRSDFLGILDESDILHASLGDPVALSRPVRDAMTGPIRTATPPFRRRQL